MNLTCRLHRKKTQCKISCKLAVGRKIKADGRTILVQTVREFIRCRGMKMKQGGKKSLFIIH